MKQKYAQLLILLLAGLLVITFNFRSRMTHADLFSWIDQDGIRHFSNVAPSSSAGDVEILEENNKKYNDWSPTAKRHLTFNVIKIYDGDSIKVEGSDLILMVRLVGIDAPESGRKKVQGQPFGKQAKKALTRMIDGRKIRIKSYGTGSYNRLLSEVFTENGTNVNLELIRQGMAEVYRGAPPKGFNRKPYHEAEAAAKSRKAGIWSLGSSYKSPKQWRKENPRK